MKLSACYVVYDDIEYVEMSLESIYAQTDEIAFLLNTNPWNGKERPEDRQNCLEYLQELVKKYPKAQIIEGTWDREHEQRNFGLEWSKEKNCQFCLIIDTDEIYVPSQFVELRKALEANPFIPAVHANWYTFFKQDPYYRIEPIEAFAPLICANTKQYRFYDKRAGISANQWGVPSPQYQCAFLPASTLILYHFSYARNDTYMKNKLENFEHSHEISKNWYEDVWLKFKEGDKNLHPVSPRQYAKAVKMDIQEFPINIRKYLLKK